MVAPYGTYNLTDPLIVPPFVATSKNTLAFTNVTAVSAVTALATVAVVDVPSVAYTLHEYHLEPRNAFFATASVLVVDGVVQVSSPGVPPSLVAYPNE